MGLGRNWVILVSEDTYCWVPKMASFESWDDKGLRASLMSLGLLHSPGMLTGLWTPARPPRGSGWASESWLDSTCLCPSKSEDVGAGPESHRKFQSLCYLKSGVPVMFSPQSHLEAGGTLSQADVCGITPRKKRLRPPRQ